MLDANEAKVHANETEGARNQSSFAFPKYLVTKMSTQLELGQVCPHDIVGR
jgi:hypothetical protein